MSIKIEWFGIMGWGVESSKGKAFLVFGNSERYAVFSVFPKKRRAKKEITHYINKGLHHGAFHGAYRYLNQVGKRG